MYCLKQYNKLELLYIHKSIILLHNVCRHFCPFHFQIYSLQGANKIQATTSYKKTTICLPSSRSHNSVRKPRMLKRKKNFFTYTYFRDTLYNTPISCFEKWFSHLNPINLAQWWSCNFRNKIERTSCTKIQKKYVSYQCYHWIDVGPDSSVFCQY